VGQVHNTLEEMKVDLVDESLRVKFVPDSDALGQCYDLGLQVAEKLQALCKAA
jgi:flavorubredoxin